MSESAHRIMMNIFLLTPLREGRRHTPPDIDNNVSISTHAPAGGATMLQKSAKAYGISISTHAPAGGAT